MSATVVVTTPTGKIGSKLVPLLLERGASVRVIARDPDKLASQIRERVEVIQGSSDDPQTLSAAFAGAAALFCCIPPTDDAPLPVYTRFAEAAKTALEGASVTHVVTISSGGKGRAVNAGPISALHAMEDVLNQTDTNIRHLRCGNFMENFLYQVAPMRHQGAFYYPMRGDIPMPHVCSADIAAVAAHWLSERSWAEQRGVGVHGPEDLSLEQVAKVLSAAVGSEIRFQGLTPEVFTAAQLSRGAAATDVQSMVEMCQGVEQGIYSAEPRTAETTTPTTLLEWASAVLKPAFLES
jgi:uncharacterized protein YbjT (DUF2867 family)